MTLVILGAETLRGMRWLERRLPSALWQSRSLLVCHRGGELDAVLWSESLRDEARRAGVRLSIGVAGLEAGSPDAALVEANRAFGRASALGGDITLAHSSLLPAAA